MADNEKGSPHELKRIADRLESIAGDVSMGFARPRDVAEQDVRDLFAAAAELRTVAEDE